MLLQSQVVSSIEVALPKKQHVCNVAYFVTVLTGSSHHREQFAVPQKAQYRP